MNAPIIAFFTNKGGVGKTFLIYHIAWMMARKGLRVIAADLDPQANLTASFLDEQEMTELVAGGMSVRTGATVYAAVAPVFEETGDITEAPVRKVGDRIGLVPGDLALLRYEQELSSQWQACLDGTEWAFRAVSAFWRLLDAAAADFEADAVLVDVGPNLGAINRSALIAVDHVVTPLAPDLFSLQVLHNLGPALREWREQWHARIPKNPNPHLRLPAAAMAPAGYLLLEQTARIGQPSQAYQRWMERMPEVYRTAVLGVAGEKAPPLEADPLCLGRVRHYRSLMPMSYEARKPVFDLKPADGAFGGHQAAVNAAAADFSALTDRILHEVGLHSGPAGEIS